jgi:hypothetical protein
MMGRGGRAAAGGGDNAMMGGMGQAMPAAPMSAPTAMSAQGQAFVQRLQQRAAELQQEPFLPPRLRNELNEITDLIRRIESGEQALG